MSDDILTTKEENSGSMEGGSIVTNDNNDGVDTSDKNETSKPSIVAEEEEEAGVCDIHLESFRQRRLTYTKLSSDLLASVIQLKRELGDDVDDDNSSKEDISDHNNNTELETQRKGSNSVDIALETTESFYERPEKKARHRSSSTTTVSTAAKSLGDDAFDGDESTKPQDPHSTNVVNEDGHSQSLKQQQSKDDSGNVISEDGEPKSEEAGIPFPCHIVGTYSCHGIEPVLDSDFYRDDDNRKHYDSFQCIRTKSVTKINQDRGGVAFPYANSPHTAIFAVYDGHGVGGENVAQYALHEVPRRLERHQEFHKGNIDIAMKDVFIDVDNALLWQDEIEPYYSGCTACVVLVRGKQLVMSNVGDSRAILAHKGSSTSSALTAMDLTIDQNPDSVGEKERIESMGGFVSLPPKDGLSARVWLDSSHTQIGLAMSRSLGDHILKGKGVIAEPVVSKHALRDEDEFLIIATDGVWEFLSSQNAVDIVSETFNEGMGSSVACQRLIEAAASKWHEYEGDYRDDITALVVKIKELWV